MQNKYLVVTHYIIPSRESVTSMKDFGTKGAKQVDERIHFRNSLSNKDIVNATFIIDLETDSVVKNRHLDDRENPTKDDDVVTHYMKEYSEDIQKARPSLKA